MASIYPFETRNQRIYRMIQNNPNKPEPLCIAAVDEMWDVRRDYIMNKAIPVRFNDATISDMGYLAKELIKGIEEVLAPPTRKFDEPVGLVLCGPAGRGKTHAAYALIKWIAERNPDMVAFMGSYPQVVQSLREEFSSDQYTDLGSTWDQLNNFSGLYHGLIFLDDLSSQKPTDFETDKLTMMLDRRVNGYMPFMVTTNVEPENFRSVYGERLASRIAGYSYIVDFTDETDKRAKE